MTDMKFCEGCGAALQTEDAKKAGYIPSSALEKEQLICQRCFRIKNYNEVQSVQIDENEFVQILNTIGQTNSMVVQIVDLFDVDGTFIQGLPRFIGKNPFILVANKVDLFPKTLKIAKVKHWLKQYANQHGLYPEDVFLISAEKNIGLKEVTNYLSGISKKKDIYVVGATNVGKSSFINQIIKESTGDNEIELTTSHFPGTTLNQVNIQLETGQLLVDTPGIVNKERFSEWVEPKTLKVLIPKKPIKPKVYQLAGKQTLFLGGFARIDQISETRNSFTCYISNEIQIHRTKLEKADELYQNHSGTLLSPPNEEEIANFPKLAKHSFKVANEKMDVVISGVGWITVSENAKVDVYAPKGIGVHIRKALI